MSKIACCVGMIASGKSTYCKNAAKLGHIVVNDDDVVNMLHANNYALYDKSLKILYKSIENNAISLGLCMGRTVLVDRGLNISEEGRKRWATLAQSFDVSCEAIIFPFDAPLIHAERRFNSSRGHSLDYWQDVATHHINQYDEPSMLEGFDKIYHITFEEILQGKVF